MIGNDAGSHFDPEIVEAFLATEEEIVATRIDFAPAIS
jgi:response regulator RpfG family c-di-GMP phosphodiesterase